MANKLVSVVLLFLYVVLLSMCKEVGAESGDDDDVEGEEDVEEYSSLITDNDLKKFNNGNNNHTMAIEMSSKWFYVIIGVFISSLILNLGCLCYVSEKKGCCGSNRNKYSKAFASSSDDMEDI